MIFITLNGETPELVEAAKILNQHDVTKIVFTTNDNSSIVEYADLLFLGFKSENSYFREYEVRSRLPLQIMTRILVDSYIVRTNKS